MQRWPPRLPSPTGLPQPADPAAARSVIPVFRALPGTYLACARWLARRSAAIGGGARNRGTMTSTPESGASAPQWGNDPARQAGQSGQQPGTETGSSPASEGGAGSSWSETSAGAGAPPGATGQQSQGYAMPPPMGYFAGSPVPREVTKVTFRRIVQYIIDGILVSIIPAIVWAIVGAADHGVTK